MKAWLNRGFHTAGFDGELAGIEEFKLVGLSSVGYDVDGVSFIVGVVDGVLWLMGYCRGLVFDGNTQLSAAGVEYGGFFSMNTEN